MLFIPTAEEKKRVHQNVRFYNAWEIISLYESLSGEMYLIQHYVIKIFIDLRQISGFLRLLWFPPPIKLTTKI
jgi:hypothetical protein